MKISYENSARFAFYSLLQLWKHTPKIVSLYVIDLLPFPSAPPLFPSSPLPSTIYSARFVIVGKYIRYVYILCNLFASFRILFC